MGDGTGGEGFSVCYGALPATPFGRAGVPRGLCVRFVTLHERRVDEFDIGLASLKYNNNVRRSNRKEVLQQATDLVSISR